RDFRGGCLFLPGSTTEASLFALGAATGEKAWYVGLGLVGNPPCFLIRKASHSAFAAYFPPSPYSPFRPQIANRQEWVVRIFRSVRLSLHTGPRRSQAVQ